MPAADESSLLAVIGTGERVARAAVAAWDAGHAVLPLNPAMPRAELDALLARLRPTHLDTGAGPMARPDGEPVAAGVAAVVVTSGTVTGTPKGVELTFAGLDAMGHGVSRAIGVDASRDRWLACLPLHHVAALAIVGRAWTTDVPWTAHPGFDIDRVAAAPRDEGATIVSLVPTALRRMLDAGAPVHEFACVVVGGAPCPPSLRERAETAGVRVVDAYGLSETWGGFAIDGVPIDGVDVRLGRDDEVLVRGAVVMRAYRRDPETTAGVLDTEGWFHTGDVGEWDGRQVNVIDRLKDLVISGGVNISPTEVEGVLARHPAVGDVCVVGAPDDEWGERVVAYVTVPEGIAAPTLDDLRTFARDYLSPAKLPREVRVVDEVPRSSGGKLLRRTLR